MPPGCRHRVKQFAVGQAMRFLRPGFFPVHLRFRWCSVGACICASVQWEALFKRATRLERSPVNDRDQAPIFHESPGQEYDDKFGYVHVDNIGVLSTSPARGSDVIEKGTPTFDSAGLLTHEGSVSGSQVISLGTMLDCERRRSSLVPRRFWRLRRGSDAVLSASNWFHTGGCHWSCHVLQSSCTLLDDMFSLGVQIHPTSRAVSRHSLGYGEAEATLRFRFSQCRENGSYCSVSRSSSTGTLGPLTST